MDQEKSLFEKWLDSILGSLCGGQRNCNKLSPLEGKNNKDDIERETAIC